MKVLFIGGTGNISLSASQCLLAQGVELWLLNRSGQHPALPNARCIRGDIQQPETVRDALSEHLWDAVVNWVAFTPDDIRRDVALFQGNTGHYVFISSASCYQNPSSRSIITEATPLDNPYWAYSRDKIAAERALMQAFDETGFPGTVVRPSHTYSTVLPLTIGGWQEHTTVARIKAGKPIVVQGDGEALWTLTHADDFAKGLTGLLGRKEAIGEDYHITSDEFLSWNRIYQLTAAAVGCEANIVHVTSDKICELDPEYTGTLLGDKAVSAIFDNSKIKRLVPEFEATIPYKEGIQRTIAWFEENPQRQVVDPQTDAFIERLIATTHTH